MFKKLITCFAVLFTVNGAQAATAFAAPSIKQLGTNVSANTEKPVAALPSLPKSNPDVARAAKGQDDEVDDGARVSAVSGLKTISSGRIKQSDSYNQLVDMVHKIDGNTGGTGGAIVGVTETGSGNYVKGISVDNNNRLNVERTRLLYAPVRNEGGNTIVGDAEIWLVR